MVTLTQHTWAAPSAGRCRNCIIMVSWFVFNLTAELCRSSLYDGNKQNKMLTFYLCKNDLKIQRKALFVALCGLEIWSRYEIRILLSWFSLWQPFCNKIETSSAKFISPSECTCEISQKHYVGNDMEKICFRVVRKCNNVQGLKSLLVYLLGYRCKMWTTYIFPLLAAVNRHLLLFLTTTGLVFQLV